MSRRARRFFCGDWRSCRRIAARLAIARDGASAVETGLLILPLFLFLFGIVEFGRAIWTQSALQYAVEAAARCAAVGASQCRTGDSTKSFAATQAYGLSIPTSAFTVSYQNASCGISGWSTGSQVTASYNFQPLVSGLIPQLSSVTLSAKSCHP